VKRALLLTVAMGVLALSACSSDDTPGATPGEDKHHPPGHRLHDAQRRPLRHS
jgi:hypothetical protein